jgi:hypothetical protein
MTDTSDPKAVREAIKDAKSREVIALEGLKTMMASEPGRAWLHKLLLMCDPYASAYSRDSHDTAFRCGEINIGLQVIAELHAASPDLYLQMMKENK